MGSRCLSSRLVRTAAIVFAAGVLVSAASGLGAATVLAQPPVDACTFTVDKTAAPSTVDLGGEVTVTLNIGGTCPPREHPADVILVIDRSSSMMEDGKLVAAKAAATQFVDAMDPTLVQVGIVTIGPTPVLLQPLTTDQAALRAAIAGINSTRGTNLVDALAMARDELSGARARTGVAKDIVFLTDGKHSTGPDIADIFPILDALRLASVEVYAIALGDDADESLLQQIATSPAHYYKSPTSAELAAIYQQIAGRIVANALVKAATIVDVVPTNMRYAPGYGRPVEPSVSPDGKTLTWTLADVKEPGTTLSYRIKPLQSGRWPTNVSAVLSGTDGFDHQVDVTFPIPVITVKVPVPSLCVCPIMYYRWRVRESDLTAILTVAKTDPTRYYGWNLLTDPSKPGSPPYPVPGYNHGPNPRRVCLDLGKWNLAYHPVYNRPVWRSGCLSASSLQGVPEPPSE